MARTFKSLQAARAISALLVVLYHLGGAIAQEKNFGLTAFSTPFSFGSAGVIFFFVLSGFIITYAHQDDLNKPQKLFSYLQKRFLRIYPTYWIVFLLVFSAAFAIDTTRDRVPHDLTTILKSLFLIPQDSKVVGGTGAPVIAVAWTLQYELLFYLLFTSLILSRWLSAIVFIGLTSLFMYAGVTESTKLTFPLTFFSSYYLLLFAMGMVVSAILRTRKMIPNRPAIFVWTGFTMFILIAMDTVLSLGKLGNLISILYGLASAIMIYGLVLAENNGQIFGDQRFQQLLGDSSYALYLIHLPIIGILCKISISMQLNTLGIIGATICYFVILCACIAASVIFHLKIEKPVSAYLKRHLHLNERAI